MHKEYFIISIIATNVVMPAQRLSRNVIARSLTTEAISCLFSIIGIAALPAGARNDKWWLRHNLAGRGYPDRVPANAGESRMPFYLSSKM